MAGMRAANVTSMASLVVRDGLPSRSRTAASASQAGNEVVGDAVGDVLVEGGLGAVAPQVELEGLELDDRLPRHVGDRDGGEVGLPRHRAHTGELRGLAAHLVVPSRVRVGDGYQLFRGARGLWPRHSPTLSPPLSPTS